MNPYSLEKLPYDIALETANKHRTLRRQLGISQVEMAEQSGVSLGSLKRFEQTGKISFEHLLKLAQVLDRLKDFEPVFQQEENLNDIEQLFSDKTRS